MTLRDTAAVVYRGMTSPGSVTPHEPVKTEIISLFGEADAAIALVSGVINTGRLEYETWAALAAVVTASSGQAAAVYPSDVGTHTDPVVGGTVANSGVYRWSVSPAGWRRIGTYRALEVATVAETNTGTDAVKGVSPLGLKTTTWTDRERVRMVVIGTPTATAITLRPLNATVRLTGTASQYIFEFQMPVTKGVGSYNVTVMQNDGTTTFLAAFALRDWQNQALATGTPAVGDWVEFKRADDLTFYGILRRSDVVTEPLSRVLNAVDTFGKLPSVIRPLAARKVNPNEWFIDIRPHDDHYVGATAEGMMARSDRLRFCLMNLGDFMADPGGVPTLNSAFATMQFVEQHITNQRFTALASGINVETGQVPSIFEPVIILGNYALTADTTNFQLAGPGHGHLLTTSWTMAGDLDGVITNNLQDDQLLSEFYGDVITTVATGGLGTPTDQYVGDYTYTTTYAQDADFQVHIETEFDFTVGGQVVEPGTREGGYAAMMPLSDCNRIVGYVNGVQGVIRTIYTRDGANLTLGNIEKAVAWHTSNPRIQMVWENDAGPGYTHWENGTPVAIAQQAFVISNDWGSKLYIPTYPIAGKVSVDNKILTFGSTYKIVNADPIT